jgi:hypothetical protein
MVTEKTTQDRYKSKSYLGGIVQMFNEFYDHYIKNNDDFEKCVKSVDTLPPDSMTVSPKFWYRNHV